ncbi:MAG TPA: GyrI-like domain-containing protein [Rhodocyclaceae bacterium]|nr:GyrI-like domain-containing protein [Rhodocyclaceae bacterium]
MDVRIVIFPETKVASITHLGPPQNEHATVLKLVSWKLEKRFLDQARYRSYGLHYSDAKTSPPAKYRVDFCLSIEDDVEPNPHGIVQKIIPRMRCACARDIGSRMNNKAAAYLYDKWLPESGEALSGEPLIFHYVNVGPHVKESEAITDVYMPLK